MTLNIDDRKDHCDGNDYSELFKSIKKQKFEVKLDNDTKIERCTVCKSIKIIELSGFYVCQECGIENNLIIDQGQEWRYYGSNDSKGTDPSRCGMPTNDLLPTSSIGSSVGFSTFAK